jgi:hypothetical protein
MKSLWVLMPRMEPTYVGARCHRDRAVRGRHGMDTPRNQGHSRYGNERPGQVGDYRSRGGRGGLGVFCLGRPTSPKGHNRIKLKGRYSRSSLRKRIMVDRLHIHRLPWRTVARGWSRSTSTARRQVAGSARKNSWQAKRPRMGPLPE